MSLELYEAELAEDPDTGGFRLMWAKDDRRVHCLCDIDLQQVSCTREKARQSETLVVNFPFPLTAHEWNVIQLWLEQE
ncbi:hypothetical protein UFOVP75_164 [uncultured Caudovirales phage]|uniref:Uncharacterized protein n=1 Tax=uncultured Caudovirales phage TaxID=2100421 RepID=A0A6J5L2E3_9CAUD|nr:hypothetical protein UFOVP75_164 [uncultured Caudovirales phage]